MDTLFKSQRGHFFNALGLLEGGNGGVRFSYPWNGYLHLFFYFLSVTVSLEAHHQTVEILHSNLVKLFSPLVHFCIWHIYILTCPFQNGVAWWSKYQFKVSFEITFQLFYEQQRIVFIQLIIVCLRVSFSSGMYCRMSLKIL